MGEAASSAMTNARCWLTSMEQLNRVLLHRILCNYSFIAAEVIHCHICRVAHEFYSKLGQSMVMSPDLLAQGLVRRNTSVQQFNLQIQRAFGYLDLNLICSHISVRWQIFLMKSLERSACRRSWKADQKQRRTLRPSKRT